MRVTKDMIESKLHVLNVLTGASNYPYQPERTEEGHLVQNVGHYYLQGCYGAFKIERLCEHGADDVTPLGTKKEIYYQVKGMIAGIFAYKKSKKEVT